MTVAEGRRVRVYRDSAGSSQRTAVGRRVRAERLCQSRLVVCGHVRSHQRLAAPFDRASVVPMTARTLRRSVVRSWMGLLRRAPASARVGVAASDPRLSGRTAFSVVLGLWLIFFGVGIVNAVRVLVGEYTPSPVPLSAGVAARDMARIIAEIASAVLLVVLLAYRFQFTRAQLGWPTAAERVQRARRVGVPDGCRLGLIYLGVLGAMSAGMTALRSLFGGAGYPAPPPSGWPGVLSGVTSSVAAGVIEELMLVALLVTALEAARQPVWVIYLTAIVVRVSFHLYYAGQEPSGLISLLPMVAWAAVTVALFRWARLVVPLITVHALWDIVGHVSTHVGPEWADTVVLSFVVGGTLLLVTYAAWTSRRQRRVVREELVAALAATATRMGVSTPSLRLQGSSWPELYESKRGVVVGYDWRSAGMHTQEQRAGWLAHALAHLQLGHAPRSAVLDRTRRTGLGSVAVLVPVVVFGFQHPEVVPDVATYTALLAAELIALVVLAGFWWRRRRLQRTSEARFALELEADRVAAAAVGTSAVMAAIATPNTYPSDATPPSHTLPSRQRRRAAVRAVGSADSEGRFPEGVTVR